MQHYGCYGCMLMCLVEKTIRCFLSTHSSGGRQKKNDLRKKLLAERKFSNYV